MDDAWDAWLRTQGDKLISGYLDYKVTWPSRLQEMEIQALGERGYYTEGQRGTLPASQASAGIPASWLLIGAALVGVLLLKD